MEIAIIGLPQSGKSTLFQIMTGINSREIYGETFVTGIAKIPDERFNRLVDIFKPEKITPATVPFIDINATGEKAWATIRQGISGVDGLLHVIDAFTTHELSDVTKRYQKLQDEMILSDLMIVENRLEKLGKLPGTALKPDELLQASVFPKLKTTLESSHRLCNIKLSDDEYRVIKNFAFLTLKPELIVLNIAEDPNNFENDFQRVVGEETTVVSICCKIESEIAELSPKDRKEFLDSMGIKTPAFEKIIQTAFSKLGKIYYFTVGEDEVRAWVVQNGATAPQAAAVIHQDFERGFIKAEVVSYADFIATGENLASAKSAGKLRLEGKDYIVKDGDIISFRFNV